jgi:hypothetical protein
MKYAPGVIAVSVLVFVAADVLFSIFTGLPEFPNAVAGGIFYMVMKCGFYLTILLYIGDALREGDADADDIFNSLSTESGRYLVAAFFYLVFKVEKSPLSNEGGGCFSSL